MSDSVIRARFGRVHKALTWLLVAGVVAIGGIEVAQASWRPNSDPNHNGEGTIGTDSYDDKIVTGWTTVNGLYGYYAATQVRGRCNPCPSNCAPNLPLTRVKWTISSFDHIGHPLGTTSGQFQQCACPTGPVTIIGGAGYGGYTTVDVQVTCGCCDGSGNPPAMTQALQEELDDASPSHWEFDERGQY